jgi:hypothetical protein
MLIESRWTAIAMPLIALAVNIAVQLTVFRARGRRDLWQSILLGFIGGLLVVSGGTFRIAAPLSSRDAMAFLFMNVVSFAGLSYGYFAFVNLNFTSLRVRLLRELTRFTDPVSSAELLGAYDAGQALDLRIDRLLQKQQLTERNGRYYVEGTPSFLFLAYILDFLKWLLLGRPLPPHAGTP